MPICTSCGIYVTQANPNACGQERCDSYKCFETEAQEMASKTASPSQGVIKLSVAGVDDEVSVDFLQNILGYYPLLEYGVLYMPEKEGAPRNPSKQWRQALLNAIPQQNIAVHLCGKDIFEDILKPDFERSPQWAELSQYSRIQLNINARSTVFTENQVVAIYDKLLALGATLILQYHDRSAALIDTYLQNLNSAQLPKVHVLMDGSLGRGVVPDKWAPPVGFEKKFQSFLAFAGGITPDNVTMVKSQLNLACSRPYGLDLESGVRTDNVFDPHKLTVLAKRVFG